MNLSQALQTDGVLQDLVINTTATLEGDECLFAVKGVLGQVNLKKVKISKKDKFKRRLFGKAYYLTNFHLEKREHVQVLGKLLKNENAFKLAVEN